MLNNPAKLPPAEDRINMALQYINHLFDTTIAQTEELETISEILAGYKVVKVFTVTHVTVEDSPDLIKRDDGPDIHASALESLASTTSR